MWAWQVYQMLRTMQKSLARIEAGLSALTKMEGRFEMAQTATLDRLKADVAANTDATKAAAAALAGYVASTADLTAKLQQAIANDDDAAIADAASGLEANNATLTANIPAVAVAVTENTPAAQ